MTRQEELKNKLAGISDPELLRAMFIGYAESADHDRDVWKRRFMELVEVTAKQSSCYDCPWCPADPAECEDEESGFVSAVICKSRILAHYGVEGAAEPTPNLNDVLDDLSRYYKLMPNGGISVLEPMRKLIGVENAELLFYCVADNILFRGGKTQRGKFIDYDGAVRDFRKAKGEKDV